MTKERQFITIKEWFYRKTEDVSSGYQCFISVYNRDENGAIPTDVVKVLVDEVIAETEKAVCVRLATGEVLGSYKGWKTWIPKSVITSYEF